MNRRNFLSMGGASLIADGIAPALSQTTTTATQRTSRSGRPNILLLMADQLRVDCAGAGNSAVRTPHLDWLARQGVRFQNAYSCTPTCTPARSALLSGMGPWRNGLMGYANMASRPYTVEKARALAEAGYYTTVIGKNHYYPIRNPHGYHHMILDEHCTYWFYKENASQESSHEERCDYEAWFWSQMPDSDPHASGLTWNDYRSAPFPYPEEIHPTHWTGETAARFLRQYNRPEPFFLKVSFIRPHSPYDPPARHLNLYKDAAISPASVGSWASRYEPRSGPGNEIWHGRLSADQVRASRQGYYASVTFLDEQLGRIFEVLEQRGMLEDTVILFLSDHGDMLGDQNLWRKSYAYEQSAHIPMLLRAPAGLGIGTPGQVVTEPVELRDVLPTCLDIAGVPVPESIEGRSLLSLLRTNGENWRSYIDLEHDVCYSPANHWNGLTDGRWKYIYHALDGEEQLFHLENDPSELTDLATLSEHAEELKRWRDRLTAHLEERGPRWVRNGKLVPRPESMLYSPNFPGYTTSEA